jgi:hypothetical protein
MFNCPRTKPELLNVGAVATILISHESMKGDLVHNTHRPEKNHAIDFAAHSSGTRSSCRLGVAGAPIVYALPLQSTDGMSLPGLLIVALENCFCCLLIESAFVGRTERVPFVTRDLGHRPEPPGAG